MLEDHIETFKGQGLAQAGLLVHLLRAGEVLSAVFVMAALEVLREEAMEEAMEEAAMAVAAMAEAAGKLEEKVSEEGSM